MATRVRCRAGGGRQRRLAGRRALARTAAALLLVCGLLGDASASSPASSAQAEAEGEGTGYLPGVVVVGGRIRSYLLHLPPGWSPLDPAPLVVGLHGGSNSASTFAWTSHLDDAVASRGWITVYPDGVRVDGGSATWNAGTCCAPATTLGVDDVAFVDALLDQVSTLVAVDPRRIFIVGHSNGGMLAYRLACELPGRIAAIGVVAAAIDDTRPCTPRHPMSLVAVHGRRDENVPLAGGYGTRGVVRVDWPSLDESVGRWRGIDRCRGLRQRTTTARAHTDRWAPCTPQGDVEQHIALGADHDWPGGRTVTGIDPAAFDATGTIVRFFARHRLLATFRPHPYQDVPAGAWYSYGLDWLAHAELMSGFADGFRPSAPLRTGQADRALARFTDAAEPASSSRVPVHRGQAATRLFGVAGSPPGFGSAVTWARRTGVLPAYADGRFHPADEVSRASFVMALYRLAATPSAWDGGVADTPFAL